MLSLKVLGRNIKKAMLEPKYALSALKKRTGAFLSYRLRKDGSSTAPESVTFFLTYKCNLRCRMCGQWGDSGSNKYFDAAKVNAGINLEGYIKLLNELKETKPHITLFGGEPLMYDNFERLIREIKSRGFHLGIITNGTLVKKYAACIIDAGVDVLSFSVDGPEELHDKVRGLKGAYKSIREGAEEIARLKKEKNTAKPVINIVCTVSELNYKSIKEMPAVAGELHAGTLNLHHLIFTENETLEAHNKYFKERFGVESKEWSGFIRPSVKEMDLEELIKDISELRSGKYPFLLTVYPDLNKKETFKYYRDKDFVSNEYPKRCFSPWVAAYIYPNGDVMPCNGLGFSAGNINSDSFLNIWNGEKMRTFRQELKKQEHFKICPKCTEMYRY